MRAVVLLAVLACVAVALSGAAVGAEARTLQRRLEAGLDAPKPKAAPAKAKAKAKAKAQPQPQPKPKAQPAPAKPATKGAAPATAAPAAAAVKKADPAPATAASAATPAAPTASAAPATPAAATVAPATAASAGAGAKASTASTAAATKVAPKAKGAKRLQTVRRLATIKGISIAEKEYQRHFSNFMRKHHRVYKAEDVTKRYAQYKQNWKFIDNFNKLKDEDKTFSLATNQFSDHSTDEFKKKLGFRSARRFAPQAVVANAAIMEGLKTTAPSTAARDAEKAELAKDAGVGKVDLNAPSAAPAAPAGASKAAPAAARFRSIPASKNWADDPNVVSPIRMQGTCGSCWSFATASVVESANAILTGVLIPAAPQHLLDCCSGATWAPCDGCNGGDFMTAYRFVTQNGMCAWADYPYTGVAPAKCKRCTSVNWISGGQVVAQAGDEVSLLAAVNNGPVATAVMANLPTFQFYSSGVYNDIACPKDFESLDHAVVLTGYGTTADGQDYWWLRNTWDTIWGEKGYMRLARGSNACGVALEATQPVARLNPASNVARQQLIAKQEADAKASASAGATATGAGAGATATATGAGAGADAGATPATQPGAAATPAADPTAQWTDPSQAAGTTPAPVDPNANAYDYQSSQQPTATADAVDYGSNEAYQPDAQPQPQVWTDYN